jgi:hypothetical protein
MNYISKNFEKCYENKFWLKTGNHLELLSILLDMQKNGVRNIQRNGIGQNLNALIESKGNELCFWEHHSMNINILKNYDGSPYYEIKIYMYGEDIENYKNGIFIK